ncbi:MAG: ABC transporter permease [Acidimicrobiales bacterium]|nr:ABC transporter permease [Acidimicrobiales bacterium]
MDLYLQTLLTGLGDGAVIAGVALGLVLAYQGSGVVNFAHGAMMMYSTYIYDELRDTGDLVFPISFFGTDRVNLLGDPTGGDLTAFWPAFLIALLVAAGLGLLVHLLVFRPLRGAPLLAKIVATVGVFIILQSIVLLRFGTQNETVRAILPTDMVQLLGTRIPEDRLWLAAIVLLSSLFLAGIYRFTLFGLATRAAAEEEKGASMLGFSPNVLAAGNWVLASVVAAVFGILAASLSNGVNTVNYTLLVVPALAGALVGALRSFGVTAVTCLALGMFRSELSLLQVKSWWPDFASSGMRDVLPFIVIIIILFFRGDRLPSRESFMTARLAFAPTPQKVLPASIMVSFFTILGIFFFDRALRLSLYLSMTSVIIVLSIVVLTGYVGQVSLAQAVFAGVSGFLLGKVGLETGIPFPIPVFIGAFGAVILGLLVGIPALRIRGLQLAAVTMALGVAIGTLLFSNRWFIGQTGALPIEAPDLFGMNLAANIGTDFNRREYGVLLLIVTLICCILVVNVRRTTTGRQFLSIRANERAAAACGVNGALTKLQAFAFSSFLAGLGGAMLAYLRGQISGESFSVFESLALLAFAYLGGIGSVSGAIVAGVLAPGGLLVGLIAKAFSGDKLSTYASLVGGVGLVLTAILNTDGIAGKIARDKHRKANLKTLERNRK